MYPVLPHGSRVRTVDVRSDARRIRAGDIVVFLWEDMVAVHRVIGRAGGGWRTKGDASLRAEARPLDASQILGLVVEGRRGGRATDLRHPLWRAAGMCIALSSRILDWKARLVPARLRNHPGLPGRLVRGVLTAGNRLVPAVLDAALRPLWKKERDADLEVGHGDIG